MEATFEMTNLGFLHYFPGLELWKNGDNFFPSTKYAKNCLRN